MIHAGSHLAKKWVWRKHKKGILLFILPIFCTYEAFHTLWNSIEASCSKYKCTQVSKAMKTMVDLILLSKSRRGTMVGLGRDRPNTGFGIPKSQNFPFQNSQKIFCLGRKIRKIHRLRKVFKNKRSLKWLRFFGGHGDPALVCLRPCLLGGRQHATRNFTEKNSKHRYSCRFVRKPHPERQKKRCHSIKRPNKTRRKNQQIDQTIGWFNC